LKVMADPVPTDAELTRQVLRELQRNGYSCFLMGFADRPQDSLRASLSFLRAIQTGDELQLAQVVPPINAQEGLSDQVTEAGASEYSVEPHRQIGPSGVRLVGVPEGLSPEEVDRLPTVAVFPYQEARGRPPVYQPALPLPPESGVACEEHMAKERILNQAREFIGADDPLWHQTEPLPPLRIGFLGNTGHGKSTLVNALLGHSMLPRGTLGACTSAVVQIRAAPPGTDTFSVKATFLSLRDFALSLSENSYHDINVRIILGKKGLKKFLNPKDGLLSLPSIDERTNRLKDRMDPTYLDAMSRGSQLSQGLSVEEVADLLEEMVVAQHGVEGQVKDMGKGRGKGKEKLGEDEEEDEEEEEEESQDENLESLSPVIVSVEISGPFKYLPYNVELVDLPGLNDAVTAREMVTKERLRMCDRAIIVLTANNAFGQKTDSMLLKTALDAGISRANIILCPNKIDQSISEEDLQVHARRHLKLKSKDYELLASSLLQTLVATCRNKYSAELDKLLRCSETDKEADQAEQIHIGAITPIVPVSAKWVTSGTGLPVPSYCQILSTGVQLLRGLFHQYSMLYDRDLRAKLAFLRQTIDQRMEHKSSETSTLKEWFGSLTIPEDELPDLLFSLSNSARAVASEIREHGQWDILSVSRNQYSPPLQCAVRDGGFFRSRSKYNRQHIDIIQDICDVIQNRLRRSFAAYCNRIARWTNRTLEEARLILLQMNQPGIDRTLQPVRQALQHSIRNTQGSLSDDFLRQRIYDYIHFGLHPNFFQVLMDDTKNAVRGICQVLQDQLQSLEGDIMRSFQQLWTGLEQEPEDTQLEELLSLLESVGALRQDDISFLECPLCLEATPAFYHFIWCSHKHTSCFSCSAQWIQEALGDASGRFPFRCPDTSCREIVTSQHIRTRYRRLKLTSKEMHRFEQHEILAGMDRPVYCPNKDCGLPMEKSTIGEDGHAKCPYCGMSFCDQCRQAFHPGQECQKLAETEDLILKTTRPCPSCQFRVTHYRGHACHHIRPGGGCPQCHTHWCYNCGNIYPCGRCRAFCSDECSCPDCPFCKPGQPCSSCDADGSCRRCRPRGGI